MKTLFISAIMLAVNINAASANTDAVNTLMESYKAQGVTLANASRGEEIWNKKSTGKAPYAERSCNRCHTRTLTNAGKHIRTGKIIPALSPAVNSRSLTKVKKIKKWFKRNCKWTLGRECTAQEKADLISFISQQ